MSNEGKPNYKRTLRLPKTDFPMRAGLVKSEPERLAKWESYNLYERIQENRAGAPAFILHDGPPFANGDVHMGTALNKILKDLVVKSKTMAGNRAGDCAHRSSVRHQHVWRCHARLARSAHARRGRTFWQLGDCLNGRLIHNK